MHVLIIGGSGHVGSLVLPALSKKHQLRVFDLQPPQDETLDFFEGNINDLEALRAAAIGMDAIVYMAMGRLNWEETTGITSAYDINVKGVHLALQAAHEAGITQAVYTSSMSVYAEELMARHFSDEDLTPDSTHLYGFTKRLGEEVCHNAARIWGMNINALRLCFPMTEEKWMETTITGTPVLATTAEDVARAILAGVNFQAGFQAFTISGDYEQRIMNMSKAKRLLNWEPLARPQKTT